MSRLRLDGYGLFARFVAVTLILGSIAFAYHLASRLAYVLYIGFTLKREDRTGHLTRSYGAVEAFRRFRRTAAAVMNNDALSFIALCVVTRRTLSVGLPPGWIMGAGAALVVVGVATKLWAVVTLGGGAYYWQNFFGRAARGVAKAAAGGPYRFLKNPMYTVGYLPAYGLALMTGSLPGVVAALIDQAAILTFYRRVEKPHFDRYIQQAG
ncbi:MAG TPA: methyltransferase [Gemmatimonadales bacterium]|jgi:protein-S-isoprenylcysteine O-methyltransferase Ste14